MGRWAPGKKFLGLPGSGHLPPLLRNPVSSPLGKGTHLILGEMLHSSVK